MPRNVIKTPPTARYTQSGQRRRWRMVATLAALAVLVGAAVIVSALRGRGGARSISCADVVLGAERMDVIVPGLRHKNVALVVNHTSVVNGVRLVDTLQKAGVVVEKIFCPEHGCAGSADAGEKVSTSVDSKTGLPIVSLYGAHKKPTRQQLEAVDVVVFDIQDVGARFYTYISTLQYVMEACAESGKTLWVLDRPNPNGQYVDGPVLQPAYASFVGLIPIPIVHGMTVGEIARMLNGEGWLQGGVAADLEVVALQHYRHSMPYAPPLPPSPNLPTYNAIKWYPSLCLFEGAAISVGRGTPSPFEQIGHPDLSASFDFFFTPQQRIGMAKNPRYKGTPCYGIDLRDTAPPEGTLTLRYLIEMFEAYPRKEEFFNSFFDKLAGNHTLQEQIKQGMSEQAIKATWQPELKKFKKTRSRYLLYED